MIYPIAKKNTLNCPWFKFCLDLFKKINISYVPKKHKEVRNERGKGNKRPQGGKQSFVIEWFRRKEVGEVGSYSKGFKPERSSGMGLY